MEPHDINRVVHMWRKYSAIKPLGTFSWIHDWENQLMNHWKCGHQRCSCLMLLKPSLSYRLVVIDRQAGFMWSFYVKSFHDASGVWSSGMWQPGWCRCHACCVRHSLHTITQNQLWFVQAPPCVCVCHALTKSIKHPQPPHSLHACASIHIKNSPPAPLKLCSQHF